MSQTAQSLQIEVSCTKSHSFNYESLDALVGSFLRGQAVRIRHHVGKSLIQIGKDLLGAKRYLSHGQFIQWVELEVGIPARTAQGYMRIAKWAEGKSATFAQLPVSLLYILSAQTTPHEVVERILDRIETGERVSVAAVRLLLRENQKRRVELFNQREEGAESDRVCASATKTRESDLAPLISEAVQIIMRRLSRDEFVRVQDIMTRLEILGDVQFSQNIQTVVKDLHRDELRLMSS